MPYDVAVRIIIFGVLQLAEMYVHRKTQRDVCWPEECKPTMIYFCGKFYATAMKGYYTTKAGDHVEANFNGCEVCMQHYIWLKEPIKVHAKQSIPVLIHIMLARIMNVGFAIFTKVFVMLTALRT